MRLGATRLDLGAPRVVPAGEAMHGIPWIFRLGLRYFARTEECVVFPVTATRSL